MRRIGILSASSGAGSRFFAANFACFLAEEGRRPAVLELAEPGLYDALGMDKRFAGRSFFPQGGPPNPAAGVNWSLIVPDGHPGAEGSPPAAADRGDADELGRFYGRLRLIDHVEGDAVLCLLNGLPERETELYLRDMDASFLIVDPLPSRLLSRGNGLKRPSGEEKAPVPIVNKMNGGVKKHELAAFLGVRTPLEVPLIPAEEIYRAEYACRVPYETKAVRDALRPAFRRIAREL